MSKHTRLDNEAPRRYQWITDGKENDVMSIGSCSSIIVEVTGDLKEPVELCGGLVSGDHLLEVIRRPGLYAISPVRMLRPKTKQSGITVTFMGVQ